MTTASLVATATRLRRVRVVLLGRSRRQGVIRSSWTVAILGALFFIL